MSTITTTMSEALELLAVPRSSAITPNEIGLSRLHSKLVRMFRDVVSISEILTDELKLISASAESQETFKDLSSYTTSLTTLKTQICVLEDQLDFLIHAVKSERKA